METGRTIAGKYRLNRALGMGGMASVWSATNVFTDRQFAIKVMLPQLARTPEAARRFLLEAKVSGRINHPNIIEVIDVGQAEDGSLFLVMELLTGMSLDVAMRRQKPPMAVHEFLAVMRDVAHALAAAHRSGVIHRDLKPTNIFLHEDRDGRVVPKVLDFGVSKILEEGNNTALTMVGTILGSPLYMSPEQAMGAEGIDGRTDVFAFGSILFEALSGQRAYRAPNLNALIVAIATTQPKRIEDVAPHLPQPLQSLIRDCMVTDKNHRLSSFDAIVDQLDPILASLDGSDLRIPPHGPADPSPQPASPRESTVRRTSDRPPPSGRGGASVSRLAMATPSPIMATKNQSSTPGSMSWPGTREREIGARSRLRAWVGGAALAAAALLVGVGAGFMQRTDRGVVVRGSIGVNGAVETSAQAPSARGPVALTALSPSASASAEPSAVPLISVDSLPVVTRGVSAARRSGRLSVAATPGSCSISVDGSPRGATPLESFELSAGMHRVECVPPNGTPRTASVAVAEGTEAHYQFTLAE